MASYRILPVTKPYLMHPKDHIEINEQTRDVLCAYEAYSQELKSKIEELEDIKNIQIDAFAIGDTISDGICMANSEGVILAINKSYFEITGLSEREVVGKKVSFFSEKGYFDHILTLRCLEEKKSVSSFSTLLSRDRSVLITSKPFFDESGKFNRVLTVIRDLTEIINMKERLEKAEEESEKYKRELHKILKEQSDQSEFIGESHEIKKIKDLIKFIAKTDATVLIEGETGCGKEVIAREIHKNSGRKDGPYIKVNCAAIPDNLLESELFGYEKGAFTGALNKNKPGMFEMANGGTLLLDEIGEMPMNLQTKLLRVLQEKEVRRIGSVSSIKLDARIIASTNQDLPALIQKRMFREDLYYRLNVVPIHIPPLRERQEDISILVYDLLAKFNKKYEKEKKIETGAMEVFESYPWPGNVRELGNVLERLVVSDDDLLIRSENINHFLGKKASAVPTEHKTTLKEAVESLEKKMIESALRHHGSTYKAASALGMSQPTLFRKAKKYRFINESDDLKTN